MSSHNKCRNSLLGKTLKNNNTTYSDHIRKQLKLPLNFSSLTETFHNLDYNTKNSNDSSKIKVKTSNKKTYLLGRPQEIHLSSVIPTVNNLINKYSFSNTSPEYNLPRKLDIKRKTSKENSKENSLNIIPINKKNTISSIKSILEELSKKGIDVQKVSEYIDECSVIRGRYCLEIDSLKLKVEKQGAEIKELSDFKKDYFDLVSKNEVLNKNIIEVKQSIVEEKEQLEKEIENLKNINEITSASQERLETDLNNLKSEHQSIVKENGNIKIINFNLKKESKLGLKLVSNIKNELKMKKFDKLFITRIKQMFLPSIKNEENKIKISNKEENQDKINKMEEEISQKEKEFLDEKEKLSNTIFTLKQIEKEHEKEKILLENYFNEKINILKLENIRLHQISDNLASLNNKEFFCLNNILVNEINFSTKTFSKDITDSVKKFNENKSKLFYLENTTKRRPSTEGKLKDLFNHISILKSDNLSQEDNLNHTPLTHKKIQTNFNFEILNEKVDVIYEDLKRMITSFNLCIQSVPKTSAFSQEGFELCFNGLDLSFNEEIFFKKDITSLSQEIEKLKKDLAHINTRKKLLINKNVEEIQYTNEINLLGKNRYHCQLNQEKAIDLILINDNQKSKDLNLAKKENNEKLEIENLKTQIQKYEEKIHHYIEEASKSLDEKKKFTEIIDTKNNILIKEKESHISQLNSFIEKNLKLESIIDNIKKNQKALQKKFKLKESENDKLINELNEIKKEKNNSFNLDLMTKLSEINTPIILKVDQTETLHCSEDDSKKSINNSRCCNIEELIKEKEDLVKILKNLSVEYLFSQFIIDNSFNLKSVNEWIIKNFFHFTSNIFGYKNLDKYSQPISFIHEYLEDIFLLINEKFRTHNSKLLIDENYIDSEMISSIAKNLSNSNLLFVIFDKYIQVDKETMINTLQEKLEDLISQTNDSSFKSILRDQIIYKDFIKKIETFNQNNIDALAKVVEQCKNTIFRGSIYLKQKEIYKLNSSKLNVIFDDKDMFVGESICSNEQLNLLIYNLKYENKKIKSIILSEALKKKEIELNRFIKTIINYCANLTSLTLNDNFFSDDQFSSIVKILELPTLINLNLNRNKLTDNNMKVLTESLDKNDNLICLHLSNNNMCSNGLMYLSKSLQKNRKLEQLFINSNQISNNGVMELVNTLISKNTTLKYLNLANNPLNSQDVLLVCKLIKKNKVLVFLDLSENSFSSQTIGELAKSLQFNNSLKELYLENIKINSNLLYNFVTSFQNCHLNQIHLSHNTISDNGSTLILKMITENINIKVLTLRNCNLSAQSIVNIAKGLQESSIEKIDLRENPKGFDDVSIKSLLKIQKNILIILSKDDLGENVENLKNNMNFNIY